MAEGANIEEVNGRMSASIDAMFSKYMYCLSWFITTNCCKLVQQLSQDLPLLVVQLVAKEWSTTPTVRGEQNKLKNLSIMLCCTAPKFYLLCSNIAPTMLKLYIQNY